MTKHRNSQIDALEKEGWVRKFTVEENRVEEYVTLYRSLGQEVRIEPVVPSEREECQICYETECGRYKTIYTKSRNEEENSKKSRPFF